MDRIKAFLKKICFFDDPGKGCFWALCLMILGNYLAATLFWFSGWEGCGKLLGDWPYSRSNTGNFPWQVIFPALGIVFTLHFFWQYWRLLISVSVRKFFIMVAAWVALAGICCAYSNWMILLTLPAILWGFGPAIFCRNARQAAVLHGTAFSLLTGCGYAIGYLLKQNLIGDHCSGYIAIKYPAWHLTYLVWLFVFLLIVTVICAGYLYSKLAGCRFKETFTLPVKVLAAVTLLTHLALIIAALICNGIQNRVKAELEAHFKMPLTNETLKAAIYQGNKPDVAFWEKLTALDKVCNDPESGYPFADFKPEELNAWRQKFNSSPQYAEMDKMLDASLPATEFNLEAGMLLTSVTSNYQMLRQMVRQQQWRIIFALERGDKAAVLAALKRIDNIEEYLSKEPFLLGQLVKMGLGSMKNKALTHVLAARILNENELLQLKAASRRTREKLPGLERWAVRSEILFGIDYDYLLYRSDKTLNGTRTLPLSTFRFLVPQYWLVIEVNEINYLKIFRKADRFHDIGTLQGDSIFTRFASVLSPSFRGAGNRFMTAELEQQCLEFFIDQEIYFLKHGKLPETEKLPFDKLNGTPVKYIRDQITVEREVFNGENRKLTIPGRQLRQAPSTEKSPVRIRVNLVIPEKL